MAVARLRPWTRPREAAWLLLCGATFRTCAPIALVVGTVLSLVNQGDLVAAGMADERVAWKIAANLLIPFLTSSLGALLAVRQRAARSDAGCTARR
ncbi:MAG: hypothetical protein WD794_02450 [Mycobacteriales bacterium]